MTKCPDLKKLQRFADGELKGTRRSRVAQHLRTCESCAEEFRQLQRMRELISGAIRKETENHDLAGLWQKVRAGMASPPPRLMGWQVVLNLLWKPAARVAYAAAAVLLVGFFVVRTLLPGPERPARIAKAYVYGVYTYDPEISVSVLMPSRGESAAVWISGLEATEEN